MTPENLTRRKILLSSLLLSLAAGGATSVSAAAKLAEGRMLVAYFSRSGNTRVVAGRVSLALDADLFDIEPQSPYPADYFETVQQAKLETERGFEPPLKTMVPGIAQYTTVFLGFPIWGMTAPPVIRSFLAGHDLAGKTIIPLVTHGGFGLGDSLEVVSRHAPNASRVDGFSIQAPQERQTIEKVTKWLEGLEPR
jgi:flavodoxin